MGWGRAELAAALAVVALAVLGGAAGGAGAGTGGMEGLEICNMDAEQLAGCLPAMRAGAPRSPSEACCAALGAADLPCLCRYKGNVLLRTVGVDPELAAALPGKCGIASPPECSGKSPPSLHSLSHILSLWSDSLFDTL
ncbi:unnamed protein product [Spirodela intermedia]|uniref:Bifunctional inhibitor/plant lipid transfer protein/seed storage helical domain-containing protein n=1 Tax=Spirodela intermedia TaxID=51605 RepID=A0A7I8LJV9_SPIIN|nr:unnamed protein product [Spirodela intermedia]